jgi:formate-dependent nitrite reductase cytochrome c552 subunit
MPLAGAIALLFAASGAPVYVNPAECAACHTRIAESYARTGMARSFARNGRKYA